MKTLKFILSFIVLLSVFGCEKNVEKIKTPTFIFTYQDAKSNYNLKYLGKDTLYLIDQKSNKVYTSSINSTAGNDLSRVINKMKKPEYFGSYESNNNDDIVYRFLILNSETLPKSFSRSESADKEVYKAAQKINDIKNDLNFVETDKIN